MSETAYSCPECHGRGKVDVLCPYCHDSTWDHECPAPTTCPRCGGAQVVADRRKTESALAQQLADVAYLDEWLSESPLSHYVIVETNRKMTAVDSLLLDETTVAEADSLPALGALLRQREGGR